MSLFDLKRSAVPPEAGRRSAVVVYPADLSARRTRRAGRLWV